MITRFICFSLLILFSAQLSTAQSNFLVEKDLSYHMKISGITQLSATILHLYALSEEEGLIVFRSHKDSLQWLFTLDDVSERGNTLQSDLRFAYLYGGSSKLHIIEPTNLLGIYSVAEFPFEVHDVARVEEFLFVNGVNGEFGFLNLISPDSVVTTYSPWNNGLIPIGKVKQVESFDKSALILSESDSLFVIEKHEKSWKLKFKMKVESDIESLFLRNSKIYGSTYDGQLFGINTQESKTSLLGKAKTFITSLEPWNDFLVTRAETGLLYLFEKGNFFELNKSSDSGNLFAVTKQNLWVTEYHDFFRLKWISEPQSNARLQSQKSNQWKLKPLNDLILPFPKPMIVHVYSDSSIRENELSFTIKSPFENIKQVQNNFVWQPTARDIGVHFFTVVASDVYGRMDSINYKVDVRPFNMPPKFAPIRPVSIPVNESYTIQFKAQDPDSPNRDLVRYVGLDLPTSSQLDEKTGSFTWTPNLQQVGIHKFRIIATDQYGTSASLDVEMTVKEVNRSGN